MKKFYTYKHTIGSWLYIGKGHGRRYLSACKNTRGKLYKHAIEKHGLLKTEILQYHASEKAALEHEIHMIALLKEAGFKLLNLTRGGEGASGYRHTDDTKRKISILQKNRPSAHKKKIKEKFLSTMNARTPEAKAETRRKQSVALKGKKKKPFSTAHIANLSLSHMGKAPANKGIPKPKEEIARRQATRKLNNR